MITIDEIERRFKEATGLNEDMTIFPMPVAESDRQATSEEDIDDFSFVPTPLWYVDRMIESIPESGKERRYTDLCCGCGQFSVRIARMITSRGFSGDLARWLRKSVVMIELNPASAAGALYVFDGIQTMYLGDAMDYAKRDPGDSGILFYDTYRMKWVNDEKFNGMMRGVLDSFESFEMKISKLAVMISEFMAIHKKDDPMNQTTLEF